MTNVPLIPGESFNMANRPGLGKRPSSTNRGVSPPLTKKQKQQSTTTSEFKRSTAAKQYTETVSGKAVANFFTPASKKEPEKMSWRIVNNSLLIGRYIASTAAQSATCIKGKQEIAAFDFVRPPRIRCLSPTSNP
jgi:bifunctional polynucleotide phosphatase/kinase